MKKLAICFSPPKPHFNQAPSHKLLKTFSQISFFAEYWSYSIDSREPSGPFLEFVHGKSRCNPADSHYCKMLRSAKQNLLFNLLLIKEHCIKDWWSFVCVCTYIYSLGKKSCWETFLAYLSNRISSTLAFSSSHCLRIWELDLFLKGYDFCCCSAY